MLFLVLPLTSGLMLVLAFASIFVLLKNLVLTLRLLCFGVWLCFRCLFSIVFCVYFCSVVVFLNSL